jgi:hypothetical protein
VITEALKLLRKIEVGGGAVFLEHDRLVIEGTLSDDHRRQVRQLRSPLTELISGKTGLVRQWRCGRSGCREPGSIIKPHRCRRCKCEFIEVGLPPPPKAKPPTWKERLERRRAERAKEV